MLSKRELRRIRALFLFNAPPQNMDEHRLLAAFALLTNQLSTVECQWLAAAVAMSLDAAKSFVPIAKGWHDEAIRRYCDVAPSDYDELELAEDDMSSDGDTLRGAQSEIGNLEDGWRHLAARNSSANWLTEIRKSGPCGAPAEAPDDFGWMASLVDHVEVSDNDEEVIAEETAKHPLDVGENRVPADFDY